MGIIQCSEGCKYQLDGYCTLEKTGTVSTINRACPYYKERSTDNRDCLAETSYSHKL